MKIILSAAASDQSDHLLKVHTVTEEQKYNTGSFIKTERSDSIQLISDVFTVQLSESSKMHRNLLNESLIDLISVLSMRLINEFLHTGCLRSKWGRHFFRRAALKDVIKAADEEEAAGRSRSRTLVLVKRTQSEQWRWFKTKFLLQKRCDSKIFSLHSLKKTSCKWEWNKTRRDNVI